LLFISLSHPGQKIFSFSFIFYPEYDGCPTVRPSYTFFFGLVASFAHAFLVMFKSEFLNGEHVIISHRLTDLPVLTTVFAFGNREVLDGEILALSTSSSLPSGGDLVLRLLAHVMPPASFFLMDTSI
jgi:hypothetical protein